MLDFVIVAGTFDRLHSGHKELLKTAAKSGRFIFIGITSEEYLKKNKPDKNIQPFNTRVNSVYKYMSDNFPKKSINIFEVNRAVEELLIVGNGGIIVTKNTRNNAIKINKNRIYNGFPALKLITVPLLTAKDGQVISSTRIRNGEIDQTGNPKKWQWNWIYLSTGELISNTWWDENLFYSVGTTLADDVRQLKFFGNSACVLVTRLSEVE